MSAKQVAALLVAVAFVAVIATSLTFAAWVGTFSYFQGRGQASGVGDPLATHAACDAAWRTYQRQYTDYQATQVLRTGGLVSDPFGGIQPRKPGC